MANIIIDGTTYSGIEEVYLPNVGGVEDQFTLPPSGTIPITANGTTDVSAYQYANVNVPSDAPITQEKTATPSESIVEVTPDSGKLLSKVTINAISASYIGSGVTQKSAQTYTPGTSDQTINAGQYLSGVQTISGDANLVAGNIKNGVSIFGVTGTYSGSGTTVQTASGNFTASSGSMGYQNCGFKPDFVIVTPSKHYYEGSTQYNNSAMLDFRGVASGASVVITTQVGTLYGNDWRIVGGYATYDSSGFTPRSFWEADETWATTYPSSTYTWTAYKVG